MIWKNATLGELYDVHNGMSKASSFFWHGKPFLTFKDVFNNYFLPEQLSGLVESTDREQLSYSIKRGDVFITRTSETYDELGMSSVALRDYPEATYNGFTKRLRPKDNRVAPEFMGYYLRSPEFRSKFQQFSQMTTRASLKNENLLSLQVPLPPLDQQRRIAGVLGAYDKLIENNRKQIKLLEEAAQRLYKEWFIDLKFPATKPPSIHDGLPEGWKKGKLGDIAEFHRGKTITQKDTAEGGIPVVAGGLEPAYFHNKANTSCPVVTVSGSGANAGFCRLYTTRIWASDCSFADSGMTDNLLFAYLSIKVLSNEFRHCQRGSAQPHVYPKHVNDLDILIPPTGLLGAFREVVEPAFSEIGILDNGITAAREARDRLLPKLMSGEIEV